MEGGGGKPLRDCSPQNGKASLQKLSPVVAEVVPGGARTEFLDADISSDRTMQHLFPARMQRLAIRRGGVRVFRCARSVLHDSS